MSNPQKKWPNFPTMRPRLMASLLELNKLDLSPRALTLTRPEAHALAAICIKTAHFEVFPQTLGGESV